MKEKTLKDIKFTFQKKAGWGFVTEKIINGKRVQFFRGDDPKDEIQVEGKKIKKVKIKKWQQQN